VSSLSPSRPRWLLGAVLLAGAALCGADETRRIPETPLLKQEDYRMSLEDVVVYGLRPYWREEAPPRWEKEPLEVQPEKPSRMQWAPKYTREERDDWQPPDQLNPQPRMKIFELKF